MCTYTASTTSASGIANVNVWKTGFVYLGIVCSSVPRRGVTCAGWFVGGRLAGGSAGASEATGGGGFRGSASMLGRRRSFKHDSIVSVRAVSGFNNGRQVLMDHERWSVERGTSQLGASEGWRARGCFSG